MSNGPVRPPSIEDLDLVHNLIEQCLQLYLTKQDAVNLIFREAHIVPGYTELVWEQLEQDNPEFFERYYIQLALKQQIEVFNALLMQQARLALQNGNRGAPSPGSNESHVSGNGSHISRNGTVIQENGYHTPDNGSHRQENGFHGPSNGSHRQENRFHGPSNGSDRQENGFHGPSNGSNRPENEFHGPSNGSHRRENGFHGPSNGSHRRENGSDGPVNGSHRPVNRSHRQQNGFHGPVNTSHRPEDGSDRPVNITQTRVNGSQRPENGPHLQHLKQNGACYPTDQAGGSSTRSGSLQPTTYSSMPSAFTGGMSFLQMPTPDVSSPFRGIDFLTNYNTLPIQSTASTDFIQGLNEETTPSGSDYSDSQAIFHSDGNVVGKDATMEAVPFRNVEASLLLMNESIEFDNSSLEHFVQPQNFSFPHLTMAYPNAIQNFENSSYGKTNAGSFFVCQDRVEIPEDTSGGISEDNS